jgi:hypothetical protein
MKMIKSTSITSTKGVTLISDIAFGLPRRRPAAARLAAFDDPGPHLRRPAGG